MGFLDKAKAAASDLAAKADTALNSSGSGAGGPRPGDADKYYRDLGVLTYLELTGRPADAAERERVLGALRDLDGQGALRSFALQTTPPPAPGMAGAGGFPPAPGMAGQMAPPPMPGMAGQMAPPPMPGGAAPTPPAPPAPVAAPVEPAPEAPAAPVTPPPPPSWA